MSSATLRMWEDEYGLLHPQRSAGKTRLYSEADVTKILEIKNLTQAGHSLRAISQILDQSRRGYPDLIVDLVELETSLPASDLIRRTAREARSFLERTTLRNLSGGDLLRENKKFKGIFAAVVRAAGADSLDSAASAVVVAAREMSGAARSGVAVYDSRTDSLHIRLVFSGREVQYPDYPPWPIDRLQPVELSQAMRNRKPFYAKDTDGYELRPNPRAGLVPAQIRSFFCLPLSVGSDLVGAISLTSPKVDGIEPGARDTVAHLGALTAPAIGYFLSRAQAHATGQRADSL